MSEVTNRKEFYKFEKVTTADDGKYSMVITGPISEERAKACVERNMVANLGLKKVKYIVCPSFEGRKA